MTSIVQDYYRRTFFLFLPGICNAKCYFCYVRPTFSERTKIGRYTTEKLRSFLRIIQSAGFNEVRLTGGEPLVFSDISKIIDAIQTCGMKYTLITNGIYLDRYVPLICSTRPHNITVSFHSLDHFEHILGRRIDVHKITHSMEEILNLQVNVTVTIVFLPENQSEIIDIVKHFVGIGVKRFKLIYPNQETIGMHTYTKFKDMLDVIQNYGWSNSIEIRHTDFAQMGCLQRDRGFLSLTLPDFHLYNCCAVVNHKSSCASEPFDTNTLLSTLASFYRQNQMIEGWPCKPFMTACPISLKTMRISADKKPVAGICCS